MTASSSPSPRDLQAGFRAALLDPRIPPPPDVLNPENGRFNIYRNNVVVSLIEALAAQFPKTRRVLGDDLFRTLARGYAVDHPPSSPLMIFYGERFADYLDAVDGVAGQAPMASDVARLEWLWTEAYHAPEREPVPLEILAAIPQEDLPGATFDLHPTTRWLHSEFPLTSLWRGEESPNSGNFSEDILIARPDAQVTVQTVPPGTLQIVEGLSEGMTLAQAWEAAAEAVPALDLPTSLSIIVGAKIICRV